MGGCSVPVKILDDDDELAIDADAQSKISDGLDIDLHDEDDDDEDARALRALEQKRREALVERPSAQTAATADRAQVRKRGRAPEPPVVEEPWIVKRRRANPGATLLDTGRIKPVMTPTQLVNFRVMNFLSPYIKFKPGPDLTHRHGACAGVVVAPGQILLAGGNNGSHCHRTTTVLSWAEGRGVSPTAGPTMAKARRECAAVKLDDSSILIIGGFDGSQYLKSTEVYHIGNGICVPGPDMVTPRAGMAVTKLDTGHILVLGGRNERGVLASTELWDIRHGSRFHRAPDMLMSRCGPSVVSLDERRILVLGGADETSTHNLAELLTLPVGPLDDASRMTFSLAKDIGVPRAYFAVAMLNSGSVLLIGGHDGLEFLDSTEVLNINNMEVSGGPRLQAKRARCAAALVAESHILVAAGSDDAMDLASTELLTQKEYAISPTPWVSHDD
mmetsp:Transcript_42924/g.96444  ORF Transcript_42924/g.96444 Transcript_42924/m.96444 type:complete len:446 (-) Transcript_42924:61-1398(-)